jgi:hypothetical protein
MSDRRAPLVDLQMNISGTNRREAHPLWFFVVIPTGAIRRIAQRRDLLLGSSIVPAQNRPVLAEVGSASARLRPSTPYPLHFSKSCQALHPITKVHLAD